MDGKYKLLLMQTDVKPKIVLGGFSLATIDRTTTEHKDAKGVIDSLYPIVASKKSVMICPDHIAILSRNAKDTKDDETEVCYSDNEWIKDMISNIQVNEKGEEIVKPECKSFNKIVDEYIKYNSLSRAFFEYTRSFLLDTDIADVADGVGEIYSKRSLIEILKNYENIRKLTLALQKALKDPEVVKSIYLGYDNMLRGMQTSNFPRKLPSLVDAAIVPDNGNFNNVLDEVYEYMSPSERKNEELIRILNFITERNDFREDHLDLLKQSSGFQM